MIRDRIWELTPEVSNGNTGGVCGPPSIEAAHVLRQSVVNSEKLDRMKSKSFLISVVLVCIGACCFSIVFAANKTIPGDFQLVAHYGPGYSSLVPWKLSISADGRARQITHFYRDGKKTTVSKLFKLSNEDLKQLINSIEESRFQSLSPYYRAGPTDVSSLFLRVRMRGTSHVVFVNGAYLLKDNEEVTRFLRVWNLVLEKVPSPNATQKSD